MIFYFCQPGRAHLLDNQNLFQFLYCLAACSLCSDQLPTQVVPGDGDGREPPYQPGHFSVAAVPSSFTRSTRKNKTKFYSSLSSSFLTVNQGTRHIMSSSRGLSTFLLKLNIWRQQIPYKCQEYIAHIKIFFSLGKHSEMITFPSPGSVV